MIYYHMCRRGSYAVVSGVLWVPWLGCCVLHCSRWSYLLGCKLLLTVSVPNLRRASRRTARTTAETVPGSTGCCLSASVAIPYIIVAHKVMEPMPVGAPGDIGRSQWVQVEAPCAMPEGEVWCASRIVGCTASKEFPSSRLCHELSPNTVLLSQATHSWPLIMDNHLQSKWYVDCVREICRD